MASLRSAGYLLKVSKVGNCSSTTVTFEYGARRDLGMNHQQVEVSIAKDVAARQLVNRPIGPLKWGTVVVNGREIEYRPYNRGQSIINVWYVYFQELGVNNE